MYNTLLSYIARINSGSMKETWRKEGSGSPAHSARIRPKTNTNSAPTMTAYSAISCPSTSDQSSLRTLRIQHLGSANHPHAIRMRREWRRAFQLS